ncbi:MAG: hypothetical protein AAGF56_05640 [Pseudomonadota bacterium]
MIWQTASFWLLVVLAVGMYAVAQPAQRAVREAEKKLTADELKTFRDNYLQKSARHDMPTKFDTLAAAQSRLSSIWIFSCILLIGALIWIIFAGPTLGLY